MLEQAHSVGALLTSDYSHHLLVMELAGGDMDDDVLSAQGAIVVRPGVAVTSLRCIETGDDLEVDEDYAVFHTGKPATFVAQFVPALRTAVSMVGWAKVKESLQDYLSTAD